MNWKRATFTAAFATMVGISAVLGGLATRAQDAAPANGCPSTTPEENAALTRAYWEEVYNGRDPGWVEAFLAKDFVRNNLARTHVNAPGFDDDAERAAENLKDFSDLEVSVDEVIASGDSVALRMTWNGTQGDPIAPWDAPVSGEPMTITVMAFYRVECGKLAEQWITFDYLSMMRQLGIVSDDELASLGAATDGDSVHAGTPDPTATEDPS